MRARTWVGGLALAAAAGIVAFYSPAADPPAAAKGPADDRDELANKLMERVSIDDPLENVKLRDAIDLLSKRFDVTILVDGRSFSPNMAAVALNAPEDDTVLDAQVTVPVMKKVRLATVLKHVTDQLNGGYLLYPDHVKFVGTGRLYALTAPTLKNYYPQQSDDDPALVSTDEVMRNIPLVNVSFAEKPLQEALRDVETRANRNIVLAPQAGERAKTPVTARFTNVPVDAAVATLAEMAGLKMARRGNVLLVTTTERAKEFDPPVPPPQGIFGGPFGVPDPQVEELKKKVAELEKTIAELRTRK